MSEELSALDQGGDDAPPPRGTHQLILILVLLLNVVNVVTVGLGNLYASTRSVAVVAVAAGLVALLGGLLLMVGR